MKVLCINNSIDGILYTGITVGKWYNIIGTYRSSANVTSYQINNDSKSYITYHSSLFKTVIQVREDKLNLILS